MNKVKGLCKKKRNRKDNRFFLLQFILCCPVGAALGCGYFYGVMKRFDLSYELSLVLGISSLVCFTIAFTSSKQVRCTSVLIVPSMFSREGRYWTNYFIYSQLIRGPVNNTLKNVDEFQRVFSCSSRFFIKHKKSKGRAVNGPALHASKNIATRMQAADKDILNYMEFHGPERFKYQLDTGMIEPEPGWENGTNQEADSRNQDYNSKSVLSDSESQCLEAAQKFKEKCQLNLCSFVPVYLVDYCNYTSYTASCERDYQEMLVKCRLNETGDDTDRTYNDIRKSMSGSTSTITAKAKESERVTDQLSEDDVEESAKHELGEARNVVNLLDMVFQHTLSLLFLLTIWKAWKYKSQYMEDINFDNKYVTSYFKKIDARRSLQGRPTLLPLRPVEQKHIAIFSSLKLIPEERKKQVKGVMLWLNIVIIGLIILSVDRHIYWLLGVLAKHGLLNITQEGYSRSENFISGTGAFAETVRKIFENSNYSYTFNSSFTNIDCLPKPSKLDISRVNEVIGALTLQLCLIALEAYAERLRRATSTFFYRKREKARILYLYNMMLRKRHVNLKNARHHLRRKAFVEGVKENAGVSILCINIPPKVTCLICELKLKKLDAERCCICKYYYCSSCWLQCKGMCLVCTSKEELESKLSHLTTVSGDHIPTKK